MANKAPTEAQIAEFEMLWPILRKLLHETKDLSNKKPDTPLNKLKVGMINKVIEPLKVILSNEPIAQYLELLNDETLPTNSDAVYVMAQFDAAMQQFKDTHYRHDVVKGGYKWFTRG